MLLAKPGSDNGRAGLRYNDDMTGENQSDRQDAAGVLRCGEERVELHVIPLDDDHHVLVALAGRGDRPERIKGQGPFPRPGVAIAVARRIAEVLRAEGFADDQGRARWQMDAWRHRRDVAETRSRFQLRTGFHPDDVLS